MSLFPICCTADIPAEFINKFLEETYDDWAKAIGTDDENYLVVLDRLGGEPFDEHTHPPIGELSSPSPFKGKTIEECARLLREEAKREGSNIDAANFIVLDERTLEDSTILIVQALGKRDDDEDEDEGEEEKNKESGEKGKHLNGEKEKDDEVELEITSFRSIYRTAESSIMCISICHPDIGEYVYMAEEEEDGVFRR